MAVDILDIGSEFEIGFVLECSLLEKNRRDIPIEEGREFFSFDRFVQGKDTSV